MKTKIPVWIPLTMGLALGVALGGCAGGPVPARTASQVEPPKPPQRREPLPPLPVNQIREEKKPPVQRFSLEVRDAPLREVLEALVKNTPFSIVLEPDVDGKITVNFRNVTLEEALENILSPLGFGHRREATFVRVFKLRPVTRIFRLNYIGTIRSGTSRISVGGERLSGSTTTISTRDEADIFAEVERGVKAILSPAGKVEVNRQGSAVIVTDLPSRLELVAKYLESIEGALHRQVQLQAKILEVTLSDEFQLGIDWNALKSAGTLRGILPGGFGLAQRLSPANAIFQVGVQDGDISVLLGALSRQGHLKTLANPKVSTLNNQRAVIRVGKEDVFFRVTTTRREVTAPTTAVATAQAAVPGEVTSVTPETVIEGVVLDVTPQIAGDGFIVLNIHPSITERVGEATSRFGDVVPVMSVRESETVIRVRDGQTVVLGGLTQERNREVVTSVPGLGRLPLIGVLFRQTVRRVEKTELVILLTPTIVRWQEEEGPLPPPAPRGRP